MLATIDILFPGKKCFNIVALPARQPTQHINRGIQKLYPGMTRSSIPS